MSLAAVASALDGDDLHPELFFNVDTTSVYLEEPQILHVVSKKVMRENRKRNIAVTTTAPSPQKRSLQLMTTISAAGELLCTIVIIKENTRHDTTCELVT